MGHLDAMLSLSHGIEKRELRYYIIYWASAGTPVKAAMSLGVFKVKERYSVYRETKTNTGKMISSGK